MKSRVVLGLSLASLLFLLGFLILADRSEARQYPTVSSTLQPIVMWSGTLAEIPDGWQLCDGTNGTPDLRDRFVLGTQTGEVPGETGGAHEVQLTEANLPSHRHYFQTETDGVHQHSFEDKHCDLFPDILAGGAVLADHAGEDYDYPSHTSDSTGDHSHTGITDHEGNAEPFDNRPACFRLAFITRVKGKPRSAFGVVKGSIIVWSGEDSSIPDGWQLCDGTNGTPDPSLVFRTARIQVRRRERTRYSLPSKTCLRTIIPFKQRRLDITHTLTRTPGSLLLLYIQLVPFSFTVRGLPTIGSTKTVH